MELHVEETKCKYSRNCVQFYTWSDAEGGAEMQENCKNCGDTNQVIVLVKNVCISKGEN